jgi:putative SOS response-associated peptidase YedK
LGFLLPGFLLKIYNFFASVSLRRPQNFIQKKRQKQMCGTGFNSFSPTQIQTFANAQFLKTTNPSYTQSYHVTPGDR